MFHFCGVVFQEDANRGKPNWEHLTDELHVLLTVEDTENRAIAKLARAVEEVKRLLIPVSLMRVDYLASYDRFLNFSKPTVKTS
jgi:hypothetical protein